MTESPVRLTPVVAVFGSKTASTLEPARSLGRALAESGCVLLTGGGLMPHKSLVKELAMEGARDAESADISAWRVGVLGTESTRVHVTETGPQLILEPNLGDGRNYLNAFMCDAAVAFPGGPGTNSEVAFALALGRPVVLVGSDWDGTLPTGNDEEALTAFIRSAQGRVSGGDGSTLGGLVTGAYDDLLRAKNLRTVRYALEESARAVAAKARELAEDDGLQGDFPSLRDRSDLEPMAKRYRDWLRHIRHSA